MCSSDLRVWIGHLLEGPGKPLRRIRTNGVERSNFAFLEPFLHSIGGWTGKGVHAGDQAVHRNPQKKLVGVWGASPSARLFRGEVRKLGVMGEFMDDLEKSGLGVSLEMGQAESAQTDVRVFFFFRGKE